MSPQERKRRWRRIVLVLGIALVLLVGAAAAFVITQQEGDVSNPDVEFREEPAATPEPEVEPEEPGGKKTDPVDRFIWAHYGYTRDRRRYLPLKNPPRPPFREIWQYQGNVLLEFPPVIGGKRLYLLNDHGVLYGDRQAHRARALAPQARRARRRLPRLRGRHGLRRPAPAREERRGARVGRVVALDGKTGRIEWSQRAREPQRVLAAGRRRARSTSARRTAPSTRWTRDNGERPLALPRGRRGQGRARAGRRQALLRRLRRPRVRDPAEQRRPGLARVDERRPLRARRRQLLLHARRRLRPRVHRQHRRPHVLVLRRRRQARVEPEHGRLRLRLARRRRGAGRAPARLLRLLQRPLLRARRAQRRRALVARRLRPDLRRRDA